MAEHYGIAGKSARSMARKRAQTLLICAVGLFLLSALLLLNIPNISQLGPAAVLVLFGGVAVLVKVVDQKTDHLAKRAKDATRGAKAEERVAEKIRELPQGYHGFHDIAFEGFNIDHVVIGPGGIFLIETKSHGGKVEAKGDTLLLNGRAPEKDFLKQTWSQTYQLRDFLFRQTSRAWKVTPVLCFSRAFVQVRGRVKGIEVVNAGYLGRFFAKQPVAALTQEDVTQLSRVMRRWTTRLDREREV